MQTIQTDRQTNRQTAINYDRAEQQFIDILEIEDLDKKVAAEPERFRDLEKAISFSLWSAYQSPTGDNAAHLFLQRILYRINRLKFFWYDDLHRYTNENSAYLLAILKQIEDVWSQWELAQIDVEALQLEDVKQGLKERAAVDVNPPDSADGRYFREQMTEAGYRQLLAITSVDGLVEASQLSRTLAGVANDVQAVMTRLLMEEYGGGRLARKHSSFFTTMLAQFDLNLEPEAYLALVPWESLAATNYGFIISERKRYFLRYIGSLLYFETSIPAAFTNYQAAGVRLGLSSDAMAYWNLHIKVDALHGRWMLDDAALPLVDRYPAQAWELLLGYDQQRLISERAGAAIARAVRETDDLAVRSRS
ncbi:iron-containing redox enzyme family protein [Oscillatoriales cyanobacterium LEGE 11467]|uniref:Iron-containing redox enzyme family protein n=1 Tax=Zarconia navalis LEGE 11467 TaxID=1828826 RepID=A0A928VYQ1_9CYAN|nr:iron-containing redox enzyme family protein [Zarconia navalis]MBE9042739.1 iron-containing redox enzyme family protein [Zarconia navalis LEGE 11467]